MGRLVVVSNHVPLSGYKRTGAEGGLAVALRSAMSDRGGLWFGWNGRVAARPSGRPAVSTEENITYTTYSLSKQDYDEFYMGYANRSLWPLFHYRLDLMEYDRQELAGYQRVNTNSANALFKLLEPDDLIWVHDYHLIQLAAQLRKAGCRHRVGFFLHIPWPTPEVLIALPNHRDLVQSLFAYDLIGFQTEIDLHNFHDYVRGQAAGRIMSDGRVRAFESETKAGAYPISIDTANVADYAKRTVNNNTSVRLRKSLNNRDLIIGVDRLDYTKGLVGRLDALDYLLRSYPHYRNRVSLLQITPPSRSELPEYENIRHELETTAGRVNGTHAEFDWVPVRYMNKGFNRETLAGFFRISCVGLVTPLRDGMNLVAKEYVAAQDADDPGVLILSRFAGAALELNEALIVNPHDVEGVGDSIRDALEMPLDERRARWKVMNEKLVRNDVRAWRDAYLTALAETPVRK